MTIATCVASLQSLSGGIDVRQDCLVYQILKGLEVVKWQSNCWNFWKPKDDPYEEWLLPKSLALFYFCIRNYFESCLNRWKECVRSASSSPGWTL